ncbi:MAG: hypothetical protein ACRDY1_05205, partial [Acidimicrobiales bacterium]
TFATVQILLGLGIAWRPTVKVALTVSVGWSLAVWWFGEGLGGVLRGSGTPIAGGPGAVLFYGLLAVLLWPAERDGIAPTFVAARALGMRAAKAVWAVVWSALAYFALTGSGRSPQGVRDLIESESVGEPGWLVAIDRRSGSLVSHEGLAVAVVLAAVCALIGLGIYLPDPFPRSVVAAAVVVAVVVWVVGQNFGMLFPGSATDPDSGPLLILVALAYWPRRRLPVTPEAQSGTSALALGTAGE